MKARKKRGMDVPPKIRAFINSVTTAALENIEVPLSDFAWDYEKGDFHHWCDLFHLFDSFFDKYIKSRKDLQLDGDILEADDIFPKNAVLQILRVTRIILENCANKYLYSSHENVTFLLASTDPDIVIAALQTLAALVRKQVQSNRTVRWHGDPVMNGRLFSLSQGWGGKEEGLGLLSCAIENGCDADASKLGSTLHFEFYADGSVNEDLEVGERHEVKGLQVIHISDMHLRPEGDLHLLKQLSDEYQVPLRLRFSLLTRLRFARAFNFLPLRRQYICIRLLAFTVLLQSNPDHEDLTTFFVNEPEFVNELVSLLHAENSVPENIRVLAVLALAAQAQDRPRQSNVLSVVSAGGHRGILPSLVQKAVVSVTTGLENCSAAFVEALLSLVTVLVSSSSGCAALREAGLIPTLLPLLKDLNPQHVDLVSSAVHILEAFMDYSNPAGTLFRDLGGLDDTIVRLQFEVSQVEKVVKCQREDLQVSEKGKASMIEDADPQQIAAGTQSEALIPYRQRLLLKALLRAIALGTYASGNTARLHGSEENALPACLCSIFRHAKEFGGGVFSLAASVMSDLINKDPTCFPVLHAAGLPAAFLDSINAGVLPSSDAVGCIPHALDALCLNPVGLQAVKDYNAIHCFVKIFTSKTYLRALAGDTPGTIASGLDELMRHAPSLRGSGIDACIEILKTIAVVGGAIEEINMPAPGTDPENTELPTPMDTDLEEKTSASSLQDDWIREQITDSPTESSQPNLETFLPECISNSVQLLETILQNADSCRVFIEKKGIEALLQLFTLPHLPLTFGGSSTAYNIYVSFRAFSSQHAPTLTKAVCTALRDHLKRTLETLGSLIHARLSDLESEIRIDVVRKLSAIECFLSLTSFLVKSLTPMLAELNTSGADVLTDIGKVHRWVLWQISLVDDTKVESRREDESGNSSSGTTGTNDESREIEDDQDTFPIVRYINPISSRSGHTSRWNPGSDLLPLLQMDHGLDRRARREHVATAEILSQVARLGRLARHARTARADIEGTGAPAEGPPTQESSKRKSLDTLIYEMMMRLVATARGLYVALGKAMIVPSRRRDDPVTVSQVAKSIASSLANVLHENLSFDGCVGTSQSDLSVSVKCRYLGKVVEDLTAVIMDSRRRTCNTVMVGSLHAHGAIKQLLTTFEATSQLLWTALQTFGLPMETETNKIEGEKVEDKQGGYSWLLDTVQSYARLMEHLVTSSLLLTPPSMAQLLVQPVVGGSVPMPRDPEAFVLTLQSQVLEVVLPVWNHPMFSQCNPNLITSICSIIMQVYSGVTDLKIQRGTGSGTAGSRHNGPPPDESAISMIVEMGFSRLRAEEALRRVGINSVEMAMEWLFSHPEETSQEDDELARALALSLGNGSESRKEDANSKGKDVVIEEVGSQPPPVENMLSTCMNLLNSTDTVAFPLTDLMVTLCMRNKGQDRSKVISYLIQQLKLCKVEESGSDVSPLSTISHMLALILVEDSIAREVAAENGLVGIALDILTCFNASEGVGERTNVPKWVTALLLVLDHMLQYKPQTDSEAPNGSAGGTMSDESVSEGTGLSPDQTPDLDTSRDMSHKKPWETILGKPAGYMTDHEQRRTMTVACNFLNMKLPASTVQAVLQLCARLTKAHSVAMQFLEAGGLSALLSLPRSCLFSGFNSVAAAIIRHLLEDPQTLQQAMESEIRHTLAATLNRHNGRVSPRMFLTAMAPVVSRDPAVFMQAAAVVCQIESIGGRLCVVLAKEKEKEKEREREKEKEKERVPEKEKDKAKAMSVPSDETNSMASLGNGITKAADSLAKPMKGHKKVSQSFSHVLEQLLDVILHFVPPVKANNANSPGSATAAMEVDEVTLKDKGKSKLDENLKSDKTCMSENSAALAKVTFILNLTTEILLMYFSAVSVVLRRDTESSQGRVPFQAGGEVVGHGGLLHHVLHRLLPYSAAGTSEKLTEDEWREKLSSKAGHFLMAICVRSIEGRRRVFSEVAKSLSAFASSHEMVLEEASKPPDKKVRAFVDLINAILASHTSSGSAQAPGVSAEMAKAVLDAGMVQALTLVLQVTDLDHPDAPKLVNGIVKALEALTRAASAGDQASGAEANISKKETSNGQRADVANGQSSENGRQEDHHTETRDETVTDSVPADLQTAIRAMRALVGGDSSRDGHMDNDMSLDRDNPEDVHLRAEEEEFMNDAAEDSGDLEGVTAAAISFRMEHGTEDDLGEDDDDDEEDMDGDGGDDDEEDEDEEDEEEDDEDDLEEDEVAHLSHPDTDVEDHEDHDLEDEYDEDMAEEEEDEDDDWRENRIIEVRWRDSLTGLDHVQVLGHAGGSNFADFPMDPFQGLNIDDLFGAFRRIGGTDRRRAPAYRPFLERSSSERIRTFQHPLLTRPTLATGMGSSGVAGSSLWTSTGNIGRETEALLGGGMDVTHFYMYDGPMLGEHANDGLFGDRAIGGQAPSFFEFSMDPIYRMGRRGGRADGRFSNWTDDGQPQGGAHAAAVAQAIEEQFISQLGSLSPAEGQPSSQPTDVDHPSTLGGGQSEHTENMGLEQEAAAQIPQQNAMEHQVNRAESEQLNGGSSVSVLNDSAGQAYGLTGEVLGEQNCHTDIDVHMQDERSEPLARDVEAASQDSSGSGATVGESLRSLEVEIGSADGHDENDRHAGPDRLNAGENPPSGRGVLGRSLVSDSRVRHSDTDEDMDGAPIVGQDEEGRAQVPADLPHAQGSASGEGEQRDDQEGATQTNHSDANMNSIDPAFLEALPEDLRAEVLASQQTQPARTANHQASNMEDIDPEFLAALPPDIQAEVLAQQQAQRFLQAQQVEGQPVDMDSASIIATFPVELREEVLLTSSEAVLAALPPALLAEARLLRERAMNQYHARSLFGGAHRLGSRRNNVGASTRGPTAIDRAVGGGSSFVAGRGPSGVLGGGSKGNEADGKPLVDIAALKAMLRLLRLAQPLGKGLLQRLLLNLCVNSTTRATLVQLLLDMLRPDAEGYSMPISSTDAALSHRLYGCQWNVVYARPQLSDGVPPLVSRRVLEILTYLARNSLVANLLLYYEPVNDTALESVSHRSPEKAKEKGKAKLVDGEMLPEVSIEKPKGEVPLVLFLKLLNQPLYSRSSAHLEQVMGLLEVITSNAGVMIDLQTSSKPVDGVTPSEGVNIDSEQDGSLNPEGAATLVNVAPDDGSIQPQVAGACLETETPRPMIISESVLDHEDSEPSTSGSKQKTDPTAILMSLPKQELRHLCLLLTCEGLSDLAYTRVSEVLKKLASVAPLHRSLFISELADAAQRLSESAMSELQNLGDAEAVVLSTTSMVGGAILRVLLALSALTSGSGMKEKGQDNLLEKEQEESLSVVRDLNAALEPLWQGLSVCVGKIEVKLVTASAFSTPSSSATVAAGVPGTGGVVPPLPPGTQRVLPFIESFFVLCDKLRSVPSSSGQQELTTATACEIKEAANSASSSDSVPMPRSSSLQLRKVDEKGVTFIRFADRHRRLLNAFVRQNPGLLEKSLSLLLKTPRLIDFDNKRSYFRSRIRQQHEQQHYAPLRISVRRAYVLEDSYNQLRMRTPDELKGRLTVQFQGEEGIDAGGLTREWYQLLSRVIFDKGALLFTTVGNESTFQPNPNSVYQTEHLSYFKFVGRVVSKALFDGQLLDVYFTRSFYKHILGVKVTYHDIEAIDPDFFKNLKWVLENDISDILGLTFSIDADEEKHILYEKTEVTDYELIPGGRNIRVTEENKHEYVDLVAEHRLTTAIRPQINAFLEGFNELVSRDLISIFNDKELELLISGLPEIDLDDLKANTEYSGYTAAAPVVQWFWEVVRGFSKEDMARLLQFITGTSKVPLEGFRALQGISGPQRFQIHKAYGAPERLPSAHTCFNQLDLPEYPSKEQLQERLLLAIHEGSEGFGFG